MDESRELKKIYALLQFTIYLLVILDIFIFIYGRKLLLDDNLNKNAQNLIIRFSNLLFYKNIYISKLWALIICALTSIGTVAKKNLNLNIKKHIIFPFCFGLIMTFGSIFFHGHLSAKNFAFNTNFYDLGYIASFSIGIFLCHLAMDNISKIIHSNFGKDEWNLEGESFEQERNLINTKYSLNIPMLFYYQNKVNNGYINIINPFRGIMVIGTPGSGKSFGIINPAIRQFIDKNFTMCLYDFKFPDLAKIAYYHYQLAKQNKKLINYKFHVINIQEIEKSRRINPLKSSYINTLADASEAADAIIGSLQKSNSDGGGSEQFFTQSAVNFLASCIYFLAKHENGKNSTLAHLLAFLNRTYEEIFNCLNKLPILESLLSPFASALQKRAFDQLEGQIGTLKIFISRLNTYETAWVFSGDDFNLKISDKENPAILVLANSPQTQNINSACYASIVNRLSRLINDKGNLPCAIIADEAPTFYIHKVENLVSTARSNKVSVILGLQETPQLKQLQGKDTAETIQSVFGNIICGSLRNKDTLQWIETLGGKKKQIQEGLNIDRNKNSQNFNEKYEPILPAGKIANLKTGEVVGIIAQENIQNYNGKYSTSTINCKINLNLNEIKHEEENYLPMPNYYDFKGKKKEILENNFMKIRNQINDIIQFYTKQEKALPQPQ